MRLLLATLGGYGPCLCDVLIGGCGWGVDMHRPTSEIQWIEHGGEDRTAPKTHTQERLD